MNSIPHHGLRSRQKRRDAAVTFVSKGGSPEARKPEVPSNIFTKRLFL
jgi:hypothetical protein